jgi:hypothetical protein
VVCELCERDAEDNYEFHHFYPGKQRRSKKDKSLHNEGINVCNQCGDQIHLMFDNRSLRDTYNNLESLKSGMSKYIEWVKDKPIDKKFSVKKLKRRL